MADGAAGDSSAPAGLWRAFRDKDTQRVFWENQQSGAVSWYVAPPDVATLTVRSYAEAKKKAHDGGGKGNNGREGSLPSSTSDVESSLSSGASSNVAATGVASAGAINVGAGGAI